MRNQDSFSPLSDITEYSFGISGINVSVEILSDTCNCVMVEVNN